MTQNERAQTNLGRHYNACYCTVTSSHFYLRGQCFLIISVIVEMLAKLAQICTC